MAMTKKLHTSHLSPPEQFCQPGDCEEPEWPGVTRIVTSAFERPSSPTCPGMGWLNRFSMFTTRLPPRAHFNLSNNKRWTEELEIPKQWMNILSSCWIELQVEGYLFMGVHSGLFHGKGDKATTGELYLLEAHYLVFVHKSKYYWIIIFIAKIPCLLYI